MLYDPVSGQLDVKKLATWVGAIAAFIAATSVVGTHVTEWTRQWLDLDNLETRVTTCEAQLAEHESELNPDPSPPDANTRLTTAMPRIAQALRDGQKERRRHDMAITRLSTIHEFGLTLAREREAAQEARRVVADPNDEEDEASSDDPIVGLSDL